MFRAILNSTVRHFSRNLSFSIISMSGLVVGLTTSILVFMWVAYELSYDRYHPDNARVFGILSNASFEGGIETSEDTPIQLADFLTTDVPEVESVTRIDWTRAYLNSGAKSVHKQGIYADVGYFQVFHANIIAGNTLNLLPDNHSVVISEEMAHLLFDNGDALGKIITLDLKTDFKVTGVFAKFPTNSTLNDREFILPFHSRPRDYSEEWLSTYVKLNHATSRQAVEQKIDTKFSELFGDSNTKSLLFCLTDWRLHWSFENGKVSGGRIVYVIIFSITALFILIMACINYMNIATARAAKRAREIGVRKMTGATRPALIQQFMTESLAITFMATCISLLLAYLLLPLFSQLTEVELSFSLTDPILLAGLLGIALFTGLLAGSYPALLLSSLKPAIVLKGKLYSSLTGAGLRKALVVFQFTLSIILIFCAVVMWQQIDYMLKKDLGFDKKNIIHIYVDPDSKIPLNSFKSELLRHPAVVSVGIGEGSPIEINGSTEVQWPGKTDQLPLILNGSACDYDFLPTIGLEFVQGRNFAQDIPSDSVNFIITQRAADLLGFSNPIGQSIIYDMFHNQEGKIIGVIKDFHNDDIHVPMNPVIFSFAKEKDKKGVFIRYQESKIDDALHHIKTIFNKFQPGIPMEYGFLDRDFENQFYQEMLLRKLSVCFTIIAVIIACLGLFGLTMFNAQRRTKEIGVRKVLGATVIQVMIMLCRDFARPILISFLLAFPLGYYLMQQFLESYAFRITISTFAFLIVGLCMIGVVLLTVSYQSFLAAVKNPVESLKNE